MKAAIPGTDFYVRPAPDYDFSKQTLTWNLATRKFDALALQLDVKNNNMYYVANVPAPPPGVTNRSRGMSYRMGISAKLDSEATLCVWGGDPINS